MKPIQRALACALTSIVALGLLPLAAGPAGAVSEPQVVASGLNNPYKLNFGPDGALYVAEAGTAGDQCIEEPAEEEGGEPSQVCFGETGSVTRITDAQERVVTGLPSAGSGDEAIGAVEAVFGADGAMYIVTGLGANPQERAMFPGAERLASVLRVAPGSQTATQFADIGAFELASDPDASYNEDSPDSNPFGIEPVSGGFLVNDAGGNSLLHVDTAGQTTLRTLFPVEEAAAPPFLGMPPGSTIPMQPVPTATETAPDGDIHVGQLTGFPFEPGAADVFQIAADGSIAGSIPGFTNIIDIAFAADGTLYVLEFSSVGLLNAPPLRSQLVQVRTDGTRKVLLNDQDLGGQPPGGVTVGADGMVYVSLCNICGAGAGSVIEVDPAVASDPAAAAGCPPAQVPGSGFTDIALSVHREAIACLKWWDLVGGLTATTFGPTQTITRAQAASLTGNALVAAGVALPADPADAFSDDEGSVHELRINQLAELGLVQGVGDGRFLPSRPVTRAQVVTLMVGAYEEVTGTPPGAGANAFTDDDGSVHEANINAAAAAGWVAGTSATTFSPAAAAERAQVASFYARWLATLVSQGEAALPT